VLHHAAGIAPSAPTRSLEVTRCGSTESRENHRIHPGPRGRNGPLGANVVGERHALPRSCTTFSGGRAFTTITPPALASARQVPSCDSISPSTHPPPWKYT